MAGSYLTMFPSSEIRIVEQSSHRLVIIDPPYFAAGIAMILISLLGIAGVIFLRHGHKFGWTGWAAVFSAVPFLLIGLLFLISQTFITFDYAKDSVVIERRTLGITRAKSELALTEVAAASVIAGTGRQKGTGSLVLILNSGDNVPLGNYSSQAGHVTVARAIDAFLESHRKRVR
jgi:uncharacterized membrane protein